MAAPGVTEAGERRGPAARRGPDLRRAELARVVASDVPVMVAYYDAVGFRCQYANDRYAQCFGRDVASTIGLTFTEVVGEDVAREIRPWVDRLRATLRPVVYERQLTAPDGSGRWLEVHLVPHLADVPATEALGVSVLISDITAHRLVERQARESEARLGELSQAAQARIHHLAHHDALTGLPNRLALIERLEAAVLGARAHGLQLALLFIDLDHFQRVNESLGHLAGDTLLRTVAARVTSSLRADDLIARVGGDEFAVLLSERRSGPRHAVDVEEVAAKLIASVGAPVSVDGRMISVTPSVGIAIFPADGATSAELVRSADSAMYLAKSRGRANFQFFDASLASAALDALVLESELADALQRHEFELYYQPQVDAHDGRVLGAEALIRWNHPERGLLGADAFIPVAEERQLMLPIGQWVLHEALLCALRWRAMGLGLGPIAVNLSNIQFQSIGFVEAVAQVLPVAGIDTAGSAGLIELELTERMLMDDLEQVKPRLARLKAMGLQISIDDFGTGYSSLGHLKELPIDKLKIDRSFVSDLPEDRSAAAIIRAIIQMGQSLAMTVVAEGVETEAQRLFLAAQGCDQLQGLLISAPMPEAEFEIWLRQRGSP